MSHRTHDLSAIFDQHVAAEFVTKDLAATMATMAADPTDCVVDEMIMSFTHDIPMDTLLPGVAPTGRAARLPVVVVVVGFDGDKVGFERIYWDQASLLVQISLIDATRLPVTGAIQAEKVLDKDIPDIPDIPANQLIPR